MASSPIQIIKLTFLWFTIKKEKDDINPSFDKIQVTVLKTDGKGLHNKNKKIFLKTGKNNVSKEQGKIKWQGK